MLSTKEKDYESEQKRKKKVGYRSFYIIDVPALFIDCLLEKGCR